MICSTRNSLDRAKTDVPGRENPYGLPFWSAFVANTLVMTAVALMFRYADFVTLLGGSELHLGWIVGVGMVGSLAMRLFLGTGIDRYGPRIIWVTSLAVFAVACLAHPALSSHRGPAIFLARIAYCSAVAGIFGASVTFISGQARVERMAEMIGMLGTSGFIGIVAGTQIGDALCGSQSVQRWQVDRMFFVAAALATIAILFVVVATRGETRRAPRRRPPSVWLLRRYQPGAVLLVGVATGIGLGLPAAFLRTYAAELDIARIGLFFASYAPAAILTRLLTRRLPERLGLTPMILAGLLVLGASQLLLLTVHRQWQFLLPGVGFGIAHAVLFPTAVAAGSRSFPNRHRGLGTTLMLASFDLGQLVGAPTAGAIVHFSGRVGLSGYAVLYITVAVMLATVAGVFAASERRRRLEGQSARERRPVSRINIPAPPDDMLVG